MDEVHLVYEAENLGISGVLKDCLETRLIVVEVALEFTTLDIKDIDKYFHVAKYAFSLTGNIALHERLLPAIKTQDQFHG